MLLATPAHLAHIAAAVLSALHQLGDTDRRLLRRRLFKLLESAALPSTVVLLALYYLRRASQLPPDTAAAAAAAAYSTVSVDAPASPVEGMLAALVTAQKYLEDAAYTNRTWADLADMPLTRVNTVERALLARLRHALSVDPRELANWIDRLGRWASPPTPAPTLPPCHCYSCVQQQQQQQQQHQQPHGCHPLSLQQQLLPLPQQQQQRWSTFAPVYATSSPPAFSAPQHMIPYLPQPMAAPHMVLWAMPCA